MLNRGQKINIIEFNAEESSANSFYRSRFPLIELQRMYDDVEFMPMNIGMKLSWDLLCMFNVAFINKPIFSSSLELIKELKKCNIKVVVDLDDDYINIPKDSDIYDTYVGNTCVNILPNVLKEVDLLFVSTNVLKDLYSKYINEDKIVIVRNAFSTRIFNKEIKPAQHNFITWRGSKSHLNNILHFKDEIKEVSEVVEDTFYLLGYNANNILGLKRANSIQFKDIVSYYEQLRLLSSKIIIVPLEDTPFNRGRSTSAFLEGTYSGSTLLAPDWEQWNLPNVVRYKDKKDFKEKLIEMSRDINKFKDLDTAKNLLLDYRNLDMANNIRYESFKLLLSK